MSTVPAHPHDDLDAARAAFRDAASAGSRPSLLDLRVEIDAARAGMQARWDDLEAAGAELQARRDDLAQRLALLLLESRPDRLTEEDAWGASHSQPASSAAGRS